MELKATEINFQKLLKNIVQSCRHACTIVPIILCNTVYYAVLLMTDDQIRSKHAEQTKNCGIKIDYKNCASRWSVTHCNMMHGTHNVKS